MLAAHAHLDSTRRWNGAFRREEDARGGTDILWDPAPAADDSAEPHDKFAANLPPKQRRLSSIMAQCYMRCPSSADEWIMVEMQGELTSHEHTSFQNLTLGTLRVQDDVRTATATELNLTGRFSC